MNTSQKTAEIQELLRQQVQRYPYMKLQDIAKLLYQNEFGGGHLVTDASTSLAWLREEAQEAEAPALWVEPIGANLARLYLGHTPAIAPETLNKLFMASAAQETGTKDGFVQALGIFLAMCQEKALPFSQNEAEQWVEEYRKRGYPMVRHSEEYRQRYAPHYRVISRQFAELLPLLVQIERGITEEGAFCVAIDGGSNSGKSTMAHQLAQLYDCNIIAMDDFFLQAQQRTPARRSTPGGNLDAERFEAEVVKGLLSKKPFYYQVFDCSVMTLTHRVAVTPKPLTIVEGVYSHLPAFQAAYSWTLFLDISSEKQLARLQERNKPELVTRFIEEWIPMENIYFSAFGILQNSKQVMTIT